MSRKTVSLEKIRVGIIFFTLFFVGFFTATVILSYPYFHQLWFRSYYGVYSPQELSNILGAPIRNVNPIAQQGHFLITSTLFMLILPLTKFWKKSQIGKTFIILIAILAFLTALPSGIQVSQVQAATPTYTIDPAGLLHHDWKYLVYVSGSDAYAVNGDTCVVDYGGSSDNGGIDGADHVSVISTVLSSGLTSGRTWKEKVVLKGKFEAYIDVPSYTIIEVQGKLTLPDEANRPIIQVEGQTDIDILIGELDGNGSNQTGGSADGIRVEDSKRVSIIGLYGWGIIKNTYKYGIELYGTGSYEDILIDHIICMSTGDTSFYFGDRGYNIWLMHYKSNNSLGYGVLFRRCERVWIEDGYIYRPKVSGRYLYAWAHDVKILRNTIREAGYGGTEGNGIELESSVGASNYVYCAYNTVLDCKNYGIIVGTNAGENIWIVYNTVLNNSDGNIAPRNAKYVFHNIGYVTENSGSATISNGEWIVHGLAGTPTTVTLTPRAITYDGVTFNVAVVARNSTHFQVGAYWTNGTAISDDAIEVDWYAKYNP